MRQQVLETSLLLWAEAGAAGSAATDEERRSGLRLPDVLFVDGRGRRLTAILRLISWTG